MSDVAPCSTPGPWSFEPRVVWTDEARERAALVAEPLPAPPRSTLDGETCRLELARAIDWSSWDEQLRIRLSSGSLSAEQGARAERMRERLTAPPKSTPQGLLGLVKRAVSVFRADSLDASAEALGACNAGFPFGGDDLTRLEINDLVVRGGVVFALNVTVRTIQRYSLAFQRSLGVAPWRHLRSHFLAADDADARSAEAWIAQVVAELDVKIAATSDPESRASRERLLAGIAYVCDLPWVVERSIAQLAVRAREGLLTEADGLLVPRVSSVSVLVEMAAHYPDGLQPYAWHLLHRLDIQAVPVLCEMFTRLTGLRERSRVASVMACVESPEVGTVLAPLIDHPGLSVIALPYFERAPHLAVLALHRHAVSADSASDSARMLLTRLLTMHPGLSQALAPAVGAEAHAALEWLRLGLVPPREGAADSTALAWAHVPRVCWSVEAEKESAESPGRDVEPVVPRILNVEECRRKVLETIDWDKWDAARATCCSAFKWPATVAEQADAGRAVLTSSGALSSATFDVRAQAACAVLALANPKECHQPALADRMECLQPLVDLWVSWGGPANTLYAMIHLAVQAHRTSQTAALWRPARALFLGCGASVRDLVADYVHQLWASYQAEGLADRAAMLDHCHRKQIPYTPAVGDFYVRTSWLGPGFALFTMAPALLLDMHSLLQQPATRFCARDTAALLFPWLRDTDLLTEFALEWGSGMKPWLPVLLRNLGHGAVPILTLLLAKAGDVNDAEARRTMATALARLESPTVAAVLAPLCDDALLGAVARDWCMRRPDLAVGVLHGHMQKEARSSETYQRCLLRSFRLLPHLLGVLRSTATGSELEALDRIANKLVQSPDASPGELPGVLADPPWRRERTTVRKKPAVVKNLEPLPCDETIGWLPGQQERLLHDCHWRNESRGRLEKWNREVGLVLAYDIQVNGAPLLARFGMEALPGFLARGVSHPAAVAPVLSRVNSPRVAPIMATALTQSKQARRVAQTWLFEFAEAAATGLLPQAVGPAGKQRNAAEQALRLLCARGRRNVVDEVAHRYGPRVVEAWTTVAATDALGDVPGVLPSLPAFWIPSAGPRPLLRGRERTLPLSAVVDLALMLKFSPIDPPYAGLEMVKEACDRESLHEFAWDLLACWRENGAPPAEQWMLMALGHLGNDETARRLASHIEEWPAQGFHSRAVCGLDCLLMIGSEVALMQLQRLAEHARRSLAEHAHKRLQLLAAMHDLGEDDLLDRLVPRLGLDDEAARGLDFGARILSIGFDEMLQPYVRDAAGKRLANLPKGARLDQADKVAVAQATWRTLKKDVRQVASVQLQRLEQAMCRRRRWPLASFLATLAAHPLMRHPVRGLVWALYDAEGARVATFRVAEDGTLADPQDRAWSLPEGADAEGFRVGIPHPVTLSAGDLAAWGEVLSDYALMQPFPQLFRTTFLATDEERESLFLHRTEGWAEVPSTRLLGLERPGWSKGPTGNGGTIEWFEKPIPGTDLQFHLYLEPGVMLSMSDAWEGEQRLGEVDIQRAGSSPWAVYRQGAPTPTACLRFGLLPAEDFSEMVRDLLTLRS